MKFLQRLNNSFEVKGHQPEGTLLARQVPPEAVFMQDARYIGNEITLYPHKDGENIIAYGYNVNYVVNACIRTISKLFGKVPFYVVNIKQGEQKTFEEYKAIKWNLADSRDMAEMKKMRRKSIDGIIVDNRLHEFLNKPNRNQSGVAFREQLIGYKKLTGEGNHWFNRGVESGKQITDGRPKEMFIIPKFVLQLIGNGVDPWEIVKYQMSLPGGQQVPTPKQNILMWIEQSYQMDNFLNHLRGQSPLESVLLQIQALNEGAIREIKESVNGGANGLLFRKDAAANQKPAPDVASHIRSQINAAVNGQDVAGAVAWLAGEWGYLPFGKTSQELQRLELTEKNMDAICIALGVPPGLIKTDQTYETASSYWKQLIYGVIAPEAYSLRDAWNGSLLEMFGIDPRRNQLDCDIMALPEMSQNLKEQVAAVQNASWLSVNEKRIATSYEPLGPEYDFVPSEDIGGGLEEDLNNLEE
jgi:phage portal protein BeeE